MWELGRCCSVDDLDRIPKKIAVKDWQYPDNAKPQLGRSLSYV